MYFGGERNLYRQAVRPPRPSPCTPSHPPPTCPPSCTPCPPGTGTSYPDQTESDWNRIWAKVLVAMLNTVMSYLYLFWIALVELLSPRSLWIGRWLSRMLIDWIKLVFSYFGAECHLAAWTQFWEQGPHFCHEVQPPSTAKHSQMHKQ